MTSKLPARDRGSSPPQQLARQLTHPDRQGRALRPRRALLSRQLRRSEPSGELPRPALSVPEPVDLSNVTYRSTRAATFPSLFRSNGPVSPQRSRLAC